jgi:hypothetical protein
MTFFFPGRKEAQFFSGLLLLQKKKKISRIPERTYTEKDFVVFR